MTNTIGFWVGGKSHWTAKWLAAYLAIKHYFYNCPGTIPCLPKMLCWWADCLETSKHSPQKLFLNIKIHHNISVVVFLFFLTSLIIQFCIMVSRTSPPHIWQFHSICQNKLALWVVEIYFLWKQQMCQYWTGAKSWFIGLFSWVSDPMGRSL